MAHSSPWAKIEPIQPTTLSEIMSEEFARVLQDKEIKQFYTEQNAANKLTQVDKSPEHNVAGPSYEDQSELGAFGIDTEELIPEDVLKVIQEDAAISVDLFNGTCDSDELIAQLLQSQYDHDYNNELKRIEKHTNKHSKISISYDKYRREGDVESDSDDDTIQDYEYGYKKRDWDRFETNEKKFDNIPKCGFKIDKDGGETITKHDPDMCGVRNACRVMSFPPEFSTGDGAAFDMKLSNQVFNQLKTYSHVKKPKMHDRKDHQSTTEMGVDGRTRLHLYKLINNRIFEQVNGIISSGKEAVIIHAKCDPSYVGDLVLPKECAVKIFRTTLNEFKQRDRYIKEDWRFKERFSNQNTRVIINMWAEKEMHNLMRLKRCGVKCPEVVILKEHVLVMSFIGDNHIAAPKLKDAHLELTELSQAYEEIIDAMSKMFNIGKLVHADLSEYNILWYEGKCWFIDVAQSVEPHHPSALEFLLRDCHNIINFFKRSGLPNILTKEELFEKITKFNPITYNVSMLERIHQRGTLNKDVNSMTSIQDQTHHNTATSSYPFDLAWEKSLMDKTVNCPPIVIEATTESMKALNLQQPLESDTTTTTATTVVGQV